MADNSLKIKEEFKSTIVGFNNSGLPLGERDDLHLLAEMAVHDPFLANMFEVIASVEEITEIKEEIFLQAHPANTPTEVTDPEVEEQ